MARRIVEAGGLLYTFSPDDEVPLAGRTWGVVSARLIDEITNEPPRGRITVEADRPGLASRVASDGLVGLVGIPLNIFPNLAMANDHVNVTVKAEGYIPHHQRVAILQHLDFPNAFAPTAINLIRVHRQPVVIRGKTVRANGLATTPLAGAEVRITGFWETLPPANMIVPAQPPNLVSLQPALYSARTAAAARLQRREMTPVPGEDKFLLEAVANGGTQLKLSDRINLSNGNVILLDADHPDLREYLTIAGVSGASTPDQPAEITLTHAIANFHRDGAVVRRATPQAPGMDNQFDRDAIAGDACVFLSSMTDLNPASVVEVFDGINPTEYHGLRRFTATSDADGFFRLPPLSRVAQLEVQADHSGPPVRTRTQIFSPDYAQLENRLDLTLR